MVVKGMPDIQVSGMQEMKTFGLFLLTRGLFKNNWNWITRWPLIQWGFFVCCGLLFYFHQICLDVHCDHKAWMRVTEQTRWVLSWEGTPIYLNEFSYFSVAFETQWLNTNVYRMTSALFHESDKEMNLITLWSHFYDSTVLFCQNVYLCLCIYTCSLMVYFYTQPKINTMKTVSLQSS